MKNPIIEGYYADPDAAVFDGKLYIYPTTDGCNWEASSFKAFSSSDMEEWKDEGIVLDFKDVEWTEQKKAWAPAICRNNGKYYLYYSGNMNIGVAVSDSPTGTFVDKGDPLVKVNEYNGNAIDPDVFVDDDGQPYLYWGNTRLYAVKLNEDMISFNGEPIDITPPNFREGACIFKRNGIYYYTWCEDDTRSPNYHVRYGKGTSPMQIPEGNDVILHRSFAKDTRIRCTGHHTVFNIPNTDEWYIVYHRFNVEKFGDVEEFSSEAGSSRELCMDRLYFDDEGNILPVKPTND